MTTYPRLTQFHYRTPASTDLLRKRRFVVGLLALITALVVWHTDAHAQEVSRVQCTFLEIDASSGGGGIDSALAPLASKLKKPPFSTWKSFRLRAKHERGLSRMKAEDISLKQGGKLSVLFRQHTQSAGKKLRLTLSLAFDDKNGKRALDSKVHVDAGDYFVIVTGQTADGGGQLLAFTCKK